MAHCSTDCRSEIGVTVGLIDALISIARVLVLRDLSPRDVREALADLQADEDLAGVLAVVPDDSPPAGAPMRTTVGTKSRTKTIGNSRES
jgi:hypothetical protein